MADLHLQFQVSMVVILAAFGAALGSFLNVVIGRLPEELSIVSPRSRCPRCLTPIPMWDNIPILTWVLLKGRCRTCGVKIPPRYVLLEVLTACVVVALFVRLGLTYDFLVWLILGAMLIVIVFLDLDYWWIPDRVVYPGMAVALAASFLPGGIGWIAALWGLVPAALIYATGWTFAKLTGKEGLGFGDVKLLAMLGLALGVVPTLTLLFLASAQGVVIGGLVTLRGGHRDRMAEAPKPVTWCLDDDPDLDWTPHPRAIPFGPFLALAAFQIVLLPHWFLEVPRRLIFLLAGTGA